MTRSHFEIRCKCGKQICDCQPAHEPLVEDLPPKLTKEEFEQEYGAAWIAQHGRRAEACDCGEAGCRGWRMGSACEHDSTDEEIIDVLLPQGGETRIRVLQAACDDYCAEVVQLNQQIVDRDTTIMLQGEDVERLRADLNRANAENRAMARVVEAARMTLKHHACFGPDGLVVRTPLRDAVDALDMAQQP